MLLPKEYGRSVTARPRLGHYKPAGVKREHRCNSRTEINTMLMVRLKDFGVLKASVSDIAARFGETRKNFLLAFDSHRLRTLGRDRIPEIGDKQFACD
jgi:hypothetical protein